MAQAFYGTRISDHISQTPEKFLVCHSAPLARTATKVPQRYRGSEIGLRKDEYVDVYRAPEEVFSKKFLASLEGKPITDQHPGEFVTSRNVNWHIKGHVQNVQPGPHLPDGERSVVGDLVITDAALIEKIKKGVRELSVGYDCRYINNGDGTFSQVALRGNHVAVVSSGRAGEHVRILDRTADGTSAEMLRSGEPRSFVEIAEELHEKYNPKGDEDEKEEEEESMKIDLAEVRAYIRRLVAQEIGKALAKQKAEPDLEEVADEHPAVAKLRSLRSFIEASGDDDAKRAYNDAIVAAKAMRRSQSHLISAVDVGRAQTNAAAEFEDAARRFGARLRGEPETQTVRPVFGTRAADSTSQSDDEEWGRACERLRQESRDR